MKEDELRERLKGSTLGLHCCGRAADFVSELEHRLSVNVIPVSCNGAGTVRRLMSFITKIRNGTILYCVIVVTRAPHVQVDMLRAACREAGCACIEVRRSPSLASITDALYEHLCAPAAMGA